MEILGADLKRHSRRRWLAAGAALLLLGGCAAGGRSVVTAAAPHESRYVLDGVAYRLSPDLRLGESPEAPRKIVISRSTPAKERLELERLESGQSENPSPASPPDAAVVKDAAALATRTLRESLLAEHGAARVSSPVWRRFGPNEFYGMTVIADRTLEVLQGYLIVGSKLMETRLALPPTTDRSRIELRRSLLRALADVRPELTPGAGAPQGAPMAQSI